MQIFVSLASVVAACSVAADVVAAPAALAADVAPHGEHLSIEEIRVVRQAVYENDALLYSPDRSPEWRLLAVPRPLENLYKKHPAAVSDVLQTIMEGANPRDSSLAAGYAFELFYGPGTGIVCVEFFDKKTYDAMDKDWETSPREHWIQKLSEIRKKKDEKEKRRKDGCG